MGGVYAGYMAGGIGFCFMNVKVSREREKV
jgi:hypothetical protein